MMSDLISVIVPVYKVEPYLDACVASIVNQTYRNLEIILVDDGSPDRCPVMCDAWAAKDARIKVIHKENGGQGEARNFGILAATGQYIGFVDSDDLIAPQMYEALLAELIAKDADLIQCGMLKFYEFPLRAFPDTCAAACRMLTGEEAVKVLLTESDSITSTCPNVLLRAAIAKQTLFDLGMVNEDVMWIYRALHASRRVVLTDAQYYAYYQRAGSTMNSTYSSRNFDAIKAIRMRADAVKNDYPALAAYGERSYAGLCMYHYQWLCRLPDSEEYRAFRKRLHEKFLQADLQAVYSVTGFKYKVWYTLFRCCPALTCRLRNFLKIGL
ncbi:MAG: glycosyltransferase [Clostridia bacterium]|nr:glycosyltransferase [Clostridia bacterium]